ncbi:TonB family protein [Tenacibaculum sp. S7007]|uniref:TonB family protein n=1 Tax=Tenacibaculum pelagium TaxID=2759527 RepID=A0A839AUS6_9FLAO|nr:energy transducer TonB [Tenacibaculum pelagium]MBA6157351.1 TonB family protein [Tenacibaculum pelagium]
MKKNIFFLMLTVVKLTMLAQVQDSIKKIQEKNTLQLIGKEIESIFPGGEKELKAFLSENFLYPEKAKKARIEGDVEVSFSIDKFGNVNDIIVLKGVHKTIDSASVELVKKIPKWKSNTLHKLTPKFEDYKLSINYKISDKKKIVFVNKIPKKQTKKKIMSLFISSCKYGSYQIGDKQLIDTRMNIFERHFSEKINYSLESNTIIVKNFTIHLNSARSLIESIKRTLEVSEKKKKLIVGCSGDDLYGGYLLKEIPKESKGDPLIVVIDIQIDGKEYHSRTLTINTEEIRAHKKFPEFTHLVNKAIEKNCTKLVELIKNNYK